MRKINVGINRHFRILLIIHSGPCLSNGIKLLTVCRSGVSCIIPRLFVILVLNHGSKKNNEDDQQNNHSYDCQNNWIGSNGTNKTRKSLFDCGASCLTALCCLSSSFPSRGSFSTSSFRSRFTPGNTLARYPASGRVHVLL